MGLIGNMIQAINNSKKIENKNLCYGELENVQTAKNFDCCHKGEVVVCKQLTPKQRKWYLMRRYRTFLDADNCELDKYLTIKNSPIPYYYIPSQRKVVPFVSLDNTQYLNYFDENEEVLVNLDDDFIYGYLFLEKIKVKEIVEIEQSLNDK